MRARSSIHLPILSPLLLALTLALTLIIFPALTTSQNTNTNSTAPKRGLIYIGTDHPNDARVFTRPNSPLTWYYNYSPWPTSSLMTWPTEFAPMVHSPHEAAAAVDTIKAVINGSEGFDVSSPSSSSRGSGDAPQRITHVLSFNEPDGDTQSGGSDATPRAAAQAYLDYIAPLRQAPWNLQISLPSTTGSPRGMQWLRDFNSSCYDLDPRGCEYDFIATHWYGDLGGLTSWLAGLHDMFPDAELWLTEFGVAGLSATDTGNIMNSSLPFLDELDYLSRYAWFGTFRANDANEWTGDGVSLLDSHGRLTELGALYLGGEDDGFEEGMSDAAAGRIAWSGGLVVVLTLVWLGSLL